MKKKSLLILCSTLFIISSIFGKIRPIEEATQLAYTFLNEQSDNALRGNISSSNMQMVFSGIDDKKTKGQVPYYVYTIGKNNGYVIIAGDDRANTILGYADSGSFDPENIPDGLQFWLAKFEREMARLANTPETNQNSTLLRMSNTQYETLVSPLLGNIKWNQGYPYNNLCPLITINGEQERTVTGCVATGMAQVMKYHQWPQKGIGSNSYITNTHKISLNVDFSKTTYDWENMTDTYNYSSTEEQQTAVATLMYHCGVAVNMNYDLSSGSNAHNMALALINNFGYNPDLQLINRDYYSRNEWANLLKMELDASRPVLYSGSSPSVGHLFVCDGYNKDGLFHFNWGWAGASDGYFQLSALNPMSQGIGGGNDGDGFNSDESIVVGIRKPGNDATDYFFPKMYMEGMLQSSANNIGRNDFVSITMTDVWNLSIGTFRGSIGLALYDRNNQFIKTLRQADGINLASYYGYSSYSFATTIPTDVADGQYKLYAVHKRSLDKDWTIMPGRLGRTNFLDVKITPLSVAISQPTDATPKLNLEELSTTGRVYQDKVGRFNFTVHNSGEEYYSSLGIYIQSTNTNSNSLFAIDANLIKGETKTFNINRTVALNPGEYACCVVYESLNQTTGETELNILGEPILITIEATPTQVPNLTLLNSAFADAAAVDKNNATITANIVNNGGFYDKQMIAFIFPQEGGYSLDYIGYQMVILDKSEEQKVVFHGAIDLEPDQYIAAVFYQNEKNDWISFPRSNLPFTLVETSSDMARQKVIQGINIYPNPASDLIHFDSEELVRVVRIYNIQGQLAQTIQPNTTGTIEMDVCKLSSGTYILIVETEKENKIGKFIKK